MKFGQIPISGRRCLKLLTDGQTDNDKAKHEKFQMKNSDIFSRRGGSNEYPQSMF